MIPEKLGKYKINRVLGKGAMGIVYEGVDPVIERTVAIKTIHKALLEGEGGQELLARFKREAQAAGRLMHQNIVAIYEYGEEEGTPFIAMEFINGRELKDLIKEKVRFDVDKIVDIMTQSLDALEYVHNGGVIHRDLKPANIILLESGQVKIADFGIARVESSTMTQVGAVMGTPSYMSPEQFMGQRVTKSADLFSMGVILYELLTGEKPFAGQAVATIMQKVLNSPVEDPTTYNFDLPNAFNAVIKKALAKRPADRFQSAKEFSEAIKLAARNQYGAPAGDDATLVGAAAGGGDEATLVSPAGGMDGAATMAVPRAATPPAAAPQTAAAPPSPAAAPSKGNTGLIVGAVALLAVAGAGGWWFTRGGEVPVTPPAVQPGGTVVQPGNTPTPPAATNNGVINAVSSPAGAVIMINDQFMGVTPFQFELAPGEYQITLKKDGYYDMEASLEVSPKQSLDFNVSLEPQ